MRSRTGGRLGRRRLCGSATVLTHEQGLPLKWCIASGAKFLCDGVVSTRASRLDRWSRSAARRLPVRSHDVWSRCSNIRDFPEADLSQRPDRQQRRVTARLAERGGRCSRRYRFTVRMTRERGTLLQPPDGPASGDSTFVRPTVSRERGADIEPTPRGCLPGESAANGSAHPVFGRLLRVCRAPARSPAEEAGSVPATRVSRGGGGGVEEGTGPWTWASQDMIKARVPRESRAAEIEDFLAHHQAGRSVQVVGAPDAVTSRSPWVCSAEPGSDRAGRGSSMTLRRTDATYTVRGVQVRGKGGTMAGRRSRSFRLREANREELSEGGITEAHEDHEPRPDCESLGACDGNKAVGPPGGGERAFR